MYSTAVSTFKVKRTRMVELIELHMKSAYCDTYRHVVLYPSDPRYEQTYSITTGSDLWWSPEHLDVC